MLTWIFLTNTLGKRDKAPITYDIVGALVMVVDTFLILQTLKLVGV